MTAKPKLHPCGTCDLMVPIEGTKDDLWCHGAPPSAFPRVIVEMVDGQPIQKQVTASTYPPVRKDMLGCAKHPMVRKRLK